MILKVLKLTLLGCMDMSRENTTLGCPGVNYKFIKM